MTLGVDDLAFFPFERGKIAGGGLLFICLHGAVVELHENDGDDEDEGHEGVEVIGNGADEKLNTAHAGVKAFRGRGNGGCPRGDGRNHAHRSRGRVDEVGQLRAGNFVAVGDGAHNGAHGQAVKIVVDENEDAEDERCKLRARVGLDVRLCPAAKGSRAARGVHKRDNDAEQDKEEENTCVVGNCSNEAVVDNRVKRGDGGKVRCKQRADNDANKQRAVGFLADKGKDDGDDGRQQRPGRLRKRLAVCTLDGRRDDQNQHRRDDDDAQKHMGFVLHGWVSPSQNKKLRHDSIMTQHNPWKDDMTALRFRDSPQDLLLRPRRLPTGMGKPSSARSPFTSPVPAGMRTRLMLCATSITTVYHYTNKENLVKT